MTSEIEALRRDLAAERARRIKLEKELEIASIRPQPDPAALREALGMEIGQHAKTQDGWRDTERELAQARALLARWLRDDFDNDDPGPETIVFLDQRRDEARRCAPCDEMETKLAQARAELAEMTRYGMKVYEEKTHAEDDAERARALLARWDVVSEGNDFSLPTETRNYLARLAPRRDEAPRCTCPDEGAWRWKPADHREGCPRRATPPDADGGDE